MPFDEQLELAKRLSAQQSKQDVEVMEVLDSNDEDFTADVDAIERAIEQKAAEAKRVAAGQAGAGRDSAHDVDVDVVVVVVVS
jgi:hypothetical protein